MTVMNENDPFYFFVHVPKTGGLTFNSILVSHFNEDQIYMEDLHHFLDKSNPGKPVVRPGKIRYTRLHFPIHPFPFDREVIYLTMLRDPIERTLSLFKQDLRGYMSRDRELPTLQDWLTNDERGWNAHARLLSGNWIGARGARNAQDLIVQSEQPLDNPAFLEAAKDNLVNSFTFFGITEYFDDSLKLFKHTFPEFKFEKYESFNRAPKKQSVELSDDDMAMLERVNCLDIPLYTFAVDLFKKRISELELAPDHEESRPLFNGWRRKKSIEFEEDETYLQGLELRKQKMVEALEKTDPEWKRRKIHEFNPILRKSMWFRLNYSCSYFHWKSVTRRKKHVRVEKLGDLNITDNSLDIFIALNAMEFVRIHKPIIPEVMSKLKVGGKFYFSLPINKSVAKTFIRVQFMPHGPEPLFPALYHNGAYGEKLMTAWEFGTDYQKVLDEWISPFEYEYSVFSDDMDDTKEYLLIVVSKSMDPQ